MNAEPALPPEIEARTPFATPWEAQAFALALKLHERGLFSWADFATRLGAEIRARPEASYYECWYEAVVGLLIERSTIAPEALFAQARAVVRFRASDHHHVARTEPIAIAPARTRPD